MSETSVDSEPGRVATGIAGFDDIIGGGFTRNRLYLVEGNPGSGKTTLALQYLLEGVRLGERGLYITLSETAEELRAVAASHGWSLDGVDSRAADRRARAACRRPAIGVPGRAQWHTRIYRKRRSAKRATGCAN